MELQTISQVSKTFQQSLNEIDEEITALSTIRDIITNFISRLNACIQGDNKANLLEDNDLVEAVELLSIQKSSLKEEKTMDLETANEKLYQLTDRDVRIVYVPTMTVAAILATGQDKDGNHAEYTSGAILKDFIQKNNLETVYPAARVFGFNNPDGVPDEDPAHGYEFWVSIPETMDVPAPLVKKKLQEGLYAAHVIQEGAWDEGWLPYIAGFLRVKLTIFVGKQYQVYVAGWKNP